MEVTSGPNTLDVGDFTGDGKVDIAVATSSTLQVASGIGIGTFDAPTVVATGLSNLRVRLADTNGDGRLDLVYGDRLATNVYVRLNNGSGGFGAATAYNATINVDQVDARDLNNDGRTDLVAFSTGNPQMSVLLNSATGFGAAATYVLSNSNVMYFALADVSGDGRPDALVSELLGNVTVTLNNGAGAFGLPTSFTGGGGQGGMIAAGDLDGDGKRDIIVAGESSSQAGYVAVLINQGTNNFAAHVDYPTGSSYPGRALAVGDVSGDGRLDILVGSLFGDSDIELFPGNGNGTLGTPVQLAPDQPGDIVLRDIDANGSLDLITAGGGTLRTYPNRGSAMPFDQRGVFGYGAQVPVARTLDINDDNKTDLIATNYSTAGSSVTTRLATGGTFAGTATAAATLASYPSSMYLSDLDNDARRDLVVVESAFVQVVMNPGNGTLVAQSPFNAPSVPRGVAAADFDGDGFRDLAIGLSDGTVRLYHGNGNGSFTAPTTVWTATGLVGIGYGDVDKDGQPDLLVSSSSGATNVIEVAHGNGNGTFALSSTIALAHPAPLGLLVRDFNADSNLDILEYGNGWFGSYLGNGNGTFAAASSQVIGPLKDAATADFDGDGQRDVVALDSRSPSIVIMRGRGDGTFDPPSYFDAGAGASSLSVTDVNADGRLDVVLNNLEAVSVLWGRCL